MFFYALAILHFAGADPGFPIGGGVYNQEGEGAPTYDFATNFQKLHEIEKILVRWGVGAPDVHNYVFY